MSAGIFLGWMLCGVLVGVVARFLLPGGRRMGLLLTLALGMVGALVGGTFGLIVQGAPSESFSLLADAWPGWIAASIGAMLVIGVYGIPFRARWRQ